MKLVLIGLLVMSPMVFGSNASLDIRNFNFDYQDGDGKGSADTFSYSAQKNAGVVVTVTKDAEDFTFKVDGAVNGEYVLRNAPDLMVSARTISLKQFNFAFLDSLSLSLNKGLFISPDQELSLQGLTVNCNRNSHSATIEDQAILGCIEKLNAKAVNFSSSSVMSHSLVSALVSGMTGAIASDLGISNVNLNVSNGNYELSGHIKAQISGNGKSRGQLSYDSTKKVLTIKITEVKFSILNVTSQVFDELKKNESEKMKVNKPYVYLTL